MYQLQAMGVAQEHVEKILESVHILRQSMFGKSTHVFVDHCHMTL
jgi:hypothetical protein